MGRALRRVLFIAGEASGDVHGAGVIHVLKSFRPDVDVYGIGGERMRAEGMDTIVDASRMAIMGFVEVIRHLGFLVRVQRRLVSMLDSRRPDVVVLIDYPGFNLRFARHAKQKGIPVLYYISPQVWAWHRNRVKVMRRLVDRMKVVFPFEVDIFRGEGMNVEFVGHPVVERIGSTLTRQAFCARYGLDPDRPVLALLPGSRQQEIERILPVIASAGARLVAENGVQCVLGLAPGLDPAFVQRNLGGGPSPILIEGATYDVMCHADAAVVTSGTATLETGWFGTPMVIVYRTSPTSFAIGRHLIQVPWIGLVNIVAGRKVVPELVQNDLTEETVVSAVRPMLLDPGVAAAMRRDLAVIKERLGGPGASRRVAEGILELGEAA
jgi:lipid-A-disaccharide synthase